MFHFTTDMFRHSYVGPMPSTVAKSFRLPLCRTNIQQFSIFFQGPKFFNSLSPEISGSSSLASFKKNLKASLIYNY